MTSNKKPGFTAAGLARSLNVSAAAVSYALNGRPGVSEELRTTIISAATKLGMEVPALQKIGEKGVLGLVLADVRNPFYTELSISVIDTAREHGFEVFLSHTEDNTKSILASMRAMIDRGVDGILLTAAQADHATILRDTRAAGIPLVQISRKMRHADADFIGIDNWSAGQTIMGHVLDHGYQKVAILAGPATSTASRRRAEGYRTMMRNRNVQVPQKWNVSTGLNQTDGIKEAEYLLSLEDLPEAIVCGTDSVAIGVIDTLRQASVRVPQDVAVVGFDGLAIALNPTYDLTTIVQPRPQMARAAIALFLERRDRLRAAPRSISCQYSLYVGTSCGCNQQER